MLVDIGPVTSSSVTSWVGYARKALDEVIGDPGTDDVWIPEDTVATFTRYLDTWEAEAAHLDSFHWTSDIPADEAEYLSHAFFRIASNLSARADERGYTMAPPESEEFYRALVTSFLAALAEEGSGSAEFSEHLRSFWPGLEADP